MKCQNIMFCYFVQTALDGTEYIASILSLA
jgi:hypothetical protein